MGSPKDISPTMGKNLGLNQDLDYLPIILIIEVI